MKATIGRGCNWRFHKVLFSDKATVLVPVNFVPFNEVVGKSRMFSLFVQPRNFQFVAVLFGVLCATCLTKASDNTEPNPQSGEARIGGMTWEEAQEWWSFQPVGVVNLPSVKDVGWPLNPIDHFVLAQLEKRELSPAAAAALDTRQAPAVGVKYSNNTKITHYKIMLNIYIYIYI